MVLEIGLDTLGSAKTGVFSVGRGEIIRFFAPPTFLRNCLGGHSAVPDLALVIERSGDVIKSGTSGQLLIKSSGDAIVELLLDMLPGPYRVDLYQNYLEEGERKFIRRIGHLIIEPKLPFPLEGLAMQTHIVRQLGTLEEWGRHFQLAADLGYNCIHLTPIQHLGASNSAYCIKSHNEINPLLFTKELSEEEKRALLKRNLDEIRKKGVVFVEDVLWNHIAIDNNLLHEHPEVSFNLENTPTLGSVFSLDQLILAFSNAIDAYTLGHSNESGLSRIDNEDFSGKSIAELSESILGLLKEKNISITNPPKTEKHVHVIMNTFSACLSLSELDKYFQIDLPSEIARFEALVGDAGISEMAKRYDASLVDLPISEKSRILGNYVEASGKKYHARVNLDKALDLCTSTKELVPILLSLNKQICGHIEHLCSAATSSLMGTLKYERLDPNGPYRGVRITRNRPIAQTVGVYISLGTILTLFQYFYRFYGGKGGKEPVAALVNGWVFGGGEHGLTGYNFPYHKNGEALLKRQVPWVDNVKLRYGKRREDCPFVWKAMEKYTQEMALLFDGFRLDNAHGTPIEVAQHMLEKAREVNPNIFAVAELFTESGYEDARFTRRTGTQVIIREALRSNSPGELAMLMYQWSSQRPVGSIDIPCKLSFFTKDVRQRVSMLPIRPRAIFYDVTHDNNMPISYRMPEDSLASTVLLAMCSCAVGSTRGVDELYRRKIDLLHEKRRYLSFSKNELRTIGIAGIRYLMNKLRGYLTAGNYSEIFIEAKDDGVIVVQRRSPESEECFLSLALPAFNGTHRTKHTTVVPFEVESVFLSAHLHVDSGIEEFVQYNTHISGMRANLMTSTSDVVQSHTIEHETAPDGKTRRTRIYIEMEPGDVVVFHCHPFDNERRALMALRDALSEEVVIDVGNISVASLNALFWKCQEEDSIVLSHGTYHIPTLGDFAYGGLGSVLQLLLDRIVIDNDLGHALFQNIREGNWLFDSIIGRLRKYELGEGMSDLGRVTDE